MPETDPPSPITVDAAPLDAPDARIRAAARIYRAARAGAGVSARVSEDVGDLPAMLDAIGLATDGPAPDVTFMRGDSTGGARADAPPPGEPVRVAMAGCGVVGGALADLLAAFPETFRLTDVLVRDRDKPRPAGASRARFVTDPDAVFDADPEIVVDVLSVGPVGHDLTAAALRAGVCVVTANKQAIAEDLVALRAAATRSGAAFDYDAAVGGGTPIVDLLGRCGDGIVSIEAVLNGTVNYILEALAGGASFGEAVAVAQKAGFAEADPTADLSGADAVAKARILAVEAFGEPLVGAPACEAFDAPRREAVLAAPGRWRQMTRIEAGPDGPEARVAFERVAPDHPFAALEGERNAARVTVRSGATASVEGRGAGPTPTAHSLLAGLLDVADILAARR
ncbi:MAG: hypothetical protein AAGC56_03300 [Pseudomonadota bacterium]